MVQEGEEVPVPQPVLGGPGVGSGGPGEDFAHLLGGDDLEVEAEQRLDEAVLHSLAVVHARVGLGQAANEQALVGAQNPVIELDLKHNNPLRQTVADGR